MSSQNGMSGNPSGSSESEPGQTPRQAETGNGPTGRKKNGFMRELVEWALYILMAFVLASLIQSEVFALTEVNMSSMETTLIPHDKLIMNKLAYRFAEPRKGDILIFLKDESADGFVRRINVYLSDVSMKLHGEFRRNRLIKRVIAVPGDTLEIRDNQVIVNGQVQAEPHARIDPDENRVVNGELAPITIPEGKIFVMGDNRKSSLDSRSFGLVDIVSIEGKAVFRVMPITKFGSLYP